MIQDQELPQIENLRELFISNTPLMDVRAPVEFNQGAFPCAVNLPLMNDDERQKVGLQYKEQGQDEAIKLGHQLVNGDVKNARISAWNKFIQQNPQGVLYCFRGGLRSRISQRWVYENTGVIYPRIKGGYKALRRFLIDELDVSMKAIQPVILSGRTGIGKTILLNKIQRRIDLEGIFHHRGSVFGKHAKPQPSQIDIENSLSIALIKLRHQFTKGDFKEEDLKEESQPINIVIEDEGISIGSRRIPDVFFNRMRSSPLIILEATIEERVEITFNEYIQVSLKEYQSLFGEEKGFSVWAESLTNAMDRIQRRLGGMRHKEYKMIMENAINEQQKTGDASLHKMWIRNLLTQYYDPMYDYQLSKKEDRKVFQGGKTEVLDYLLEQYHI